MSEGKDGDGSLSQDLAWFLAAASQDETAAWVQGLPLHDLPDAFQSTLWAMAAVEGVAKVRAAAALRAMVRRSVDNGQPFASEIVVGAIRSLVDESTRVSDDVRLDLAWAAARLATFHGVPTSVAQSVLTWIQAVALACRAADALDGALSSLRRRCPGTRPVAVSGDRGQEQELAVGSTIAETQLTRRLYRTVMSSAHGH